MTNTELHKRLLEIAGWKPCNCREQPCEYWLPPGIDDPKSIDYCAPKLDPPIDDNLCDGIVRGMDDETYLKYLNYLHKVISRIGTKQHQTTPEQKAEAIVRAYEI